ncbi:MAG: phage tail tape measure protein, partial [Nitrososphaerota archaeon]
MQRQYNVKVVLEAEDHLTKALAYTQIRLRELGVTGAEEGRRLQNTFGAIGAALERAIGIGIYQSAEMLKRFVTDSVAAFARFESASVRLAAVSREAGQSVDSLAQGFRVAASAAARELAVSGIEAMEALESLVKAGLDGAEAMTALKTAIQLARLEGVEFGEASNSLVQVMAQFGLKSYEAARAADVLVNASRLGIGTAADFASGLANVGSTARAMGLSLEETAAWLVVLERRLGSAEEAGTQLNRFLLDLYEVAGKLGVPIRDGSEALRATSEIMRDVIESARLLGGDFEMLQSRLAGVDVRSVRALFTLTQIREAMDELEAEISRSGTTWEAYQSVLATTEGRSAALRAEVDRLQRSLGESAAAIYNMVAPTILKAFDAVVSGWRTLLGAITGSNFDRMLGYLENELRVFGRVTEEQASQMKGQLAGIEGVEVEGGKVSLAGEVFFDSGKATIKKSMEANLKKVAGVLKSSGLEFRIDGHTDSQPIVRSGWKS